MAQQASDDPFLEVQADVQTTLTTTRTFFASYLRIRALAATTNRASPELAQSRHDLTLNLTQLSTDLADLLESIVAVEDDPYRFGLDVAEVSRRRQFVEDVGQEVEGMRAELHDVVVEGDAGTATSTSLRRQVGKSNGTASPPPTAFAVRDSDSDDDDGEDAYGAFEQQTQEQILHEQDEQLDDVFDTVGRLRGQAVDMGRELEEQGQMLGEVDTLADRVGDKLQVGVRRVGEVIRRNEDGVSSCCIAVLIFVLILLLILVIIL